MDPVVILHLTDLHFGWEGNDPEKNQSQRDQRTNCLNSLLKKLKSLWEEAGDWKPDLLAVTGDIGWAGAADDYKEARVWLNKVLDLANLEFGDMLVCPGNHDIARDAVKRVTVPQGAQEADAWLQVPVSDDDLKGFAAFTEFCADADIPRYDFGSVGSHLVGLRESHGLHFVALNTAWYCRGNHDKNKLWVGRNHLEHLRAQHGLKSREAATNRVVVLIHHPPDWWHESETHAYGGRPNTRDALSKHSHIILSGHTHAEVRDPDRIAAAAWHSTSGASFAGAHHFNSVRLLRIFDDRFETLTLRFEPEDAESCWKEYGVRNSYPFTDTTRMQAVSAAAPVPPVIDYYLKRLAEKTATIEMMGMGRSCQIDLPIAEVYVPLRLVRSTRFTHLMTDRVPGDENDAGDADELSVGAEHADGDPSEQLSLQHVFEHCANAQKRGLVILGEPGAGKTTWAQQLAWQLASGTVTAEQLGLPVGLRPVFLKLRNLSTAALAAETDAASSLQSFLKQETVASGAPEGLQDPSDELWNDKQNGILWILDGLDEVVSPVARAAVSGWVRELRGQRTRDWFVVTSRFQGYQQDDVLLGSQFLEFHVHGLSDDQVKAFVRRWFAAAHQRQLGAGMRATEKADKDSDTLLKVLQTAPYQSPSMREMVTNPLLLTILCVVYHEEHNLPTARAELYQHCVRVLLGLWRQELYEGQEEVQPFDSDAAQTVLSCLAWWMHEAKEKTAAVADLVGQAETALRTVQAEAGLGLDGRHFIDRMREESGILAFGGEGQARCGFLHLSFQEFLAAYYAVQSGLAEQLVSRMTDSWWREVALLSLRQSRRFCEEFFAAMLAAELPQQNMDLAQRCLTESSHFVPGPFVAVLRDKSSSIAAKGSVLRLLRDRVDQVPELREICAGFAQQSGDDWKSVQPLVNEILARTGTEVAAPMRGPEAKSVLIDDKTRMPLVWIPPGEFLMGSESGRSNEQPVHEVTLSQGYYLGQYPVTNREYALFLNSLSGADRRERTPKYWDNRRFNQADQPVVGVSWHDALAYCLWSGSRLPTEAEWEYACRAGSMTAWSFGDTESDLEKFGWYEKNSGGQSQPVGTRLGNDWDLYDMHGNVWEWCADWFGENYYAESPVVDPRGPERGDGRVLRGGSWDDVADVCRSAIRFDSQPEFRNDDFGFRVARTP